MDAKLGWSKIIYFGEHEKKQREKHKGSNRRPTGLNLQLNWCKWEMLNKELLHLNIWLTK